ncbi:phosphatase PAP2 family protein [Psychromicrobium xiongbiense]|uniref:phosphatase PAP2 family protein n=1 Tax=Psychromicrobium xiongbiense TaxID=3051184 RepID=UPI0025551B69|nr:phosphatase PAP2 family protein [Psychromicrobium sp. YIM S02556]
MNGPRIQDAVPGSSEPGGWWQTGVLPAIVLALIGVAGFSWLDDAIQHGTGPALLDQPLLQWFQGIRTPVATVVFRIITTASSPVAMIIIVAAVATLWALLARRFWRPGLLVGAMLVAVSTSSTIKHLVGRSRPPVDQMLLAPDYSFAFPSGHTLSTAVFLMVLGYLVLSRRRRHRLLWFGGIVLGILAVATSRLYLGYHWLTDVTASVCLAWVILGLVMVVDTLASRRFGART